MNTEKKAILIAAFGTTVSRAAKAFSRFEATVKARFPDRNVYRAYTSSIVRRKLAGRGIIRHGVREMLVRLAEDNYRTVTVMSLHTIPGYEYELVRHDVAAFRRTEAAGAVTTVVTKPLLAGYDDATATTAALLEAVPPERKAHDALVFMGHGSNRHAADLFYVALAAILSERDSRAFLGTVEGHPTLDDVVIRCRKEGIRKAWLIPFMAIAGDHVINDLSGDSDDSWKSVLSREGITCETVMRGTLDNPGIAHIWLSHLQAAIDGTERAVLRHDKGAIPA